MAKKVDHAKHNKELCEIIRAGGKHYDWVVTTAFYSALHFVDLKIFPFKLSHDTTCETLKDAQAKLLTSNKHETRAQMVKLQCIDIFKSYRWLLDQSNNARYITYKINPQQADKAIQLLNEIEKYCTAE